MESLHILNGDALKDRFPKSISGQLACMRECLVEGPVDEKDLSLFFQLRAEFISSTYSECTLEDYFSFTVAEMEKLKTISPSTEIFLWFEDDLFCQTNFWFLVTYIQQIGVKNPLFLVRPKIHSPWGFGSLSDQDLELALDQSIPIDRHRQEISALWRAYQANDLHELRTLAKQLQQNYPFISDAVHAHLERIPTKNSLGKPSEILIDIIRELQTDDFGPLFQEFCRRAPIYGFGDSQVQRLLSCIPKDRI